MAKRRKTLSAKDKQELAELLRMPEFWAVVGAAFIITAFTTADGVWPRIGFIIAGIGMLMTTTMDIVVPWRNDRLEAEHKEKVAPWQHLTDEDVELLGRAPDFQPWEVDREAVKGVAVLLVIAGIVIVAVG